MAPPFPPGWDVTRRLPQPPPHQTPPRRGPFDHSGTGDWRSEETHRPPPCVWRRRGRDLPPPLVPFPEVPGGGFDGGAWRRDVRQNHWRKLLSLKQMLAILSSITLFSRKVRRRRAVKNNTNNLISANMDPEKAPGGRKLSRTTPPLRFNGGGR